MPATLARTLWRQDWPALRLENPALRVEVVAALGGKVVAVDSLRTGRSWLWSNPHLAVRLPGPSDTYVRDHDVGGWDEMFPTVHPCRLAASAWDEAELTDHGVLWSRGWTVERAGELGDGTAEVALTAAGDDPPFVFRRTLRLDPDRPVLTAEYRLDNRGRRPLPFVWAAHPLLPLETGARVSLPAGTTARCTFAAGEDLPVLGEPFAWPVAPRRGGGTVDVGLVPTRGRGEPGRAVKVFTRAFPDPAAWVGLTAPDGSESLRLSFRTDDIPHVGLWINDAGWSGAGTAPYRNLGLEPTTSPDDDLREADARGTAVTLAPGASRLWSLTLSLHPAD